MTSHHLVGLFLLGISEFALTQTIGETTSALDAIASFSEKICSTIPLSGTSTSVEFSSSGKAEASKLTKQLVELKIEGAAKYVDSTYKGLIRSDLVTALKDQRACKQKIATDLMRFVPTPK